MMMDRNKGAKVLRKFFEAVGALYQLGFIAEDMYTPGGLFSLGAPPDKYKNHPAVNVFFIKHLDQDSAAGKGRPHFGALTLRLLSNGKLNAIAETSYGKDGMQASGDGMKAVYAVIEK